MTDQGDSDRAIELTRSLFLRDDNHYGCAESSLVALQKLYGLPDADDSSSAMVLNGGIAYSGGVCGAISTTTRKQRGRPGSSSRR